MGGAVSTGEDNDELVDNLVDADYIKTPLVEKVFRAVDRANYYLPDHRDSAYKDLAWKHGHLHLSAPCIYSEVMESLLLEPGNSFLNLGSGTGYLSTMVGLILGHSGVNHGIEVHPDVVAYAQARLDEFKFKCKTFDDFEFCEPKFVDGNCLQIPSGGKLYDRVYCGASCPPEHENYMKNLLSVGGYLVMPLNDQLLQIHRTAIDKWESKSVMSVSFATLVTPSKQDPGDIVELPEAELPVLQDICRIGIRRILRSNIYKEHPSLKTIRKRPPKKPKKRAPRRRRINVMPMSMGMMILGHFDGSGDSEDSDDIELEHPRRARLRRRSDRNSQDDENDEDEEEEGEVEEIYDSIEEDDDDEINEEKDSDEGVVDEEEVKVKKAKKKNGANGHESKHVSSIEEGHESDEDAEPGTSSENALDDLATRLDEVRQQLRVQRQLEFLSRLHTSWQENQHNESNNKDDDDDDDDNDVEEVEEEDNTNVNIEEPNEKATDELQTDNKTEKSGEHSESSEGDKMDMDFPEIFAAPNTIPSANCSPPRKPRYSSCTSVDTSETSGIGSLSEASVIGSLGEDLIQPSTPSDKSPSDCGDLPMDTVVESEEEPLIEETPKECIKMYMKEKVHQLPLPEALKAYIMYYRD